MRKGNKDETRSGLYTLATHGDVNERVVSG